MNVKDSFRKKICWLFIVIITFQSCAIYNRTPISISEASKINKKVRVIRNDNSKAIFNRIEMVDGTYYGYKNVNGENVKIPLDEKDIKKIQKKNTTGSTFLNVGICITGIGIIFLIIYLSEPWKTDDSGNIGYIQL